MTAHESRHGPVAQLLIASSPLSLILVGYVLVDWVTAPLQSGSGTNRLGFPLHVAGPADADRALLGSVPTVWLQERLVDGSPAWYDALAALVYVTHFVSIPVLTAVVWFRLRHLYREWIGTVIGFSALGMTGYLVYPAAPPWLASQEGLVGQVERISSLGWDLLRLDAIGALTELGQGSSNPVAAMPSLHAGAALLIALFLWRVVSGRSRLLLLAYALAMAVTLVYTGEHYVVDVLAGWATAAVAVAVPWVVRRRGAVDPQPSLTTRSEPTGSAGSSAARRRPPRGGDLSRR